jgi:hypothetical protein
MTEPSDTSAVGSLFRLTFQVGAQWRTVYVQAVNPPESERECVELTNGASLSIAVQPSK